MTGTADSLPEPEEDAAGPSRSGGPAGIVRLRVTPDGEQACVTVADSGAGFGIGKIGRDSLGLEIVGALVLDCGGTVQIGTSDLGGVSVAVTLPCLPQTLAPVRELGVVLAGSTATWRDDADMPA